MLNYFFELNHDESDEQQFIPLFLITEIPSQTLSFVSQFL